MLFAQYKTQSVNPPMYGTFWREQTASGLDGAGILFALLLLGFDYLCLCLAFIGVADVFYKRQQSYSLTWWSIVFPTVTLATSWLELGSSMDSPTFRGLSTALFMFIVIVYLVNGAFTVWGIFDGSLVWAQSQLEREEEMMRKAQKMEKKRDGEV
jgi:tellurite resistance protein TehA-like permease